MPKPLVYKTGDEINLRATVVDGKDVGRPIIRIGDASASIPQVELDKADHRDDSYREPTDAERDLAEMAEEAEGDVTVTVERLVPTTAVVGGPDLTLHVFGTGFTVDTVILFNGGEELTVFVSETEVTTLVKPSLVGMAVTVPVSVIGAVAELEFAFTEEQAAGTESARRGRHR